eukprot:1190052-Prorocentrum_minimum.AAC.1
MSRIRPHVALPSYEAKRRFYYDYEGPPTIPLETVHSTQWESAARSQSRSPSAMSGWGALAVLTE